MKTWYNKDMTGAPELQPPFSDPNILTHHNDAGGRLDGVTVEFQDRSGADYAMTIRTQKGLLEEAAREALADGAVTEDGDDIEPVFVVPGNEITTDVVKGALSLPPEMLGRYVVPQFDITNAINKKPVVDPAEYLGPSADTPEN